jgi:signal transduction histidine kinase
MRASPASRSLRARIALAGGASGTVVFALLLATATDLGPWRTVGCALIGGAMVAASAFALAAWVLKPARRLASEALACSWESGRPRLVVDDPDEELGQLADAFNNLFVRLEEALEETRRFSADASHELRTPLTALRAMGEVALSKRPPDAEAFRACVEAMLEETSRLSRLVEELLMLGGGRPAKAPQPLDVSELIMETASMLRILAEERNQRLEVRCRPGLAAFAEAEMLRLALVNLVQNAIRHSPPGSRVLVVGRVSDLAVTLEVSDDGPGIAREHHARIFERFYRTDRARSRESGGTGLGLAIAKWAVGNCGGEIGLRSSLGSGSTFFICLRKA